MICVQLECIKMRNFLRHFKVERIRNLMGWLVGAVYILKLIPCFFFNNLQKCVSAILLQASLFFQETCTQPIDIECRARFTGVYSNATSQVFDTECTLEGGLVCLGSQQNAEDGSGCFDYETRLLCPQGKPFYPEPYTESKP